MKLLEVTVSLKKRYGDGTERFLAVKAAPDSTETLSILAADLDRQVRREFTREINWRGEAIANDQEDRSDAPSNPPPRDATREYEKASGNLLWAVQGPYFQAKEGLLAMGFEWTLLDHLTGPGKTGRRLCKRLTAHEATAFEKEHPDLGLVPATEAK